MSDLQKHQEKYDFHEIKEMCFFALKKIANNRLYIAEKVVFEGKNQVIINYKKRDLLDKLQEHGVTFLNLISIDYWFPNGNGHKFQRQIVNVNCKLGEDEEAVCNFRFDLEFLDKAYRYYAKTKAEGMLSN